MTDTTTITTLVVDQIEAGDNVRRFVGAVDELARSIESVGLLNPITVRANGSGFVIVAGHRRLAAVRKLGWHSVPVNVVDLDDSEATRLRAQLIENLQREDLGVMEEARGIAALVELLGSQKDAATAIARSAAHVSKRLALLKLAGPAQASVTAGTIPIEEAVELAKLDEKAQTKIAESYETRPNGARYDLESATRKAARTAAERKEAKAAAKAHPNWEVVARADAKRAWKSLEGYGGLALDQDAHEGEPCHRLVVGVRGAGPTQEEYYCADPARHGVGGESALKLSLTAEADTERKARLAREVEAEAREAEAAAWAEKVKAAAEAVDRNTALKVLSRFIINIIEQPGDYLAAAGVDVPEIPDRRNSQTAYEKALAEIVEGLTIAQSYRVAVNYVLDVSAGSSASWQRARPLSRSIAGLVGIEPEPEEN